MKTKLPYGLSILFFCLFCTLSFGQPFTPDPVDLSSSPNEICSGKQARLTMTYPQSRVKYKLFGPLSSAPIDSTLIPSNAPPYAYLSFSGANLNDGLNTLSITGFASGSGIFRVHNGSIVVDGVLDEPYWDLSNTVQYVTGSNALAKNSVTFGTAWDDSCLYIGMHVIDLTPNNPIADPTDYNNDGLEFYIDPYSIKTSYFGASPQQLAVKQIRVGSLSPMNNFNMWPGGRSPAGIQTATSTFSNGTGIKINNAGDVSVITGPGYNVEFSIKWKDFFGVSLNTAPGAGFTFGFDLACNDNQTGTNFRTEQSFWTYPADPGSWNESAGFGTITLLDGISLSGTNTLSGKSETLVGTWDVSIKKTQPIFDYGSTAFCSNYTGVIPIHTIAGFSYAGNFFYPNGIDGDGSNTGSVIISDPTLNGVIAISYLVDNPGCATTLGGIGLLTVVGLPSKPVFNYGSGFFCNDVGNVGVNTISGFIVGAFSTTASGLLFTLDANTGNISGTSPSANDIYSIVYTTDPLGPCPSVQGSADIGLNKAPDNPTITVSPTVICSGGEVSMSTPFVNSQINYTWQRKDTSPGAVYISIPGTDLTNADSPASSSFYRLKAVSGGCDPAYSPEDASPTVTVTGAPNAVFTYHPTAFSSNGLGICNQGPNIGPTFITLENATQSSGTFSSDFPLTVMDPAKNGIVVIKNATPGQFKVTFTIPEANGCPKDSSFFVFTIASSVGGTITSPIDNGNLCEGQLGSFTLNSYQGDKIKWYGQIPGQTNWTRIDTITTPDLLSTFGGNNLWNVKATVQDGDCKVIDADNMITFSSNQPSIGGVINSDQSITGICQEELLAANLTGKRGTAEWFWSLKKDTTSFLTWHPATTNTSSIDSILVADALNEANKPYGQPIYYVAKVTNGGCDPVYSSLLTIKFCDQSDYPPNALVPNAGNATSEWNLESLRLSDDARIKVFNRYGSVVYDAYGRDMKNGRWWDGGGQSAGTYWYFIEQGEGHPRKTGAVTIIK